MPKLKEVSELIEADPSLGEQITVFENELDMLTMRSNLAPLPASRDEVLALEDIYESRAKVHLSEESTESNFKE